MAENIFFEIGRVVAIDNIFGKLRLLIFTGDGHDINKMAGGSSSFNAEVRDIPLETAKLPESGIVDIRQSANLLGIIHLFKDNFVRIVNDIALRKSGGVAVRFDLHPAQTL